MDVRLDPWIAESTGENCIKIAREHGKAIWRDGDAVMKIAVSAPVEFAEFDICAGGLHNFESLRNHFLADAVSGDYGNALSGRSLRSHGRKVTQGG